MTTNEMIHMTCIVIKDNAFANQIANIFFIDKIWRGHAELDVCMWLFSAWRGEGARAGRRSVAVPACMSCTYTAHASPLLWETTRYAAILRLMNYILIIINHVQPCCMCYIRLSSSYLSPIAFNLKLYKICLRP